jgi:hypothetical protein
MLTPDVATRKLSIKNREKVRISNFNYIENLVKIISADNSIVWFKPECSQEKFEDIKGRIKIGNQIWYDE